MPRIRGAWPPLGYKGQEYGFGIVGYSGRIFGLATAIPCPRLRPDVGGSLRCECWCWMFAMGFARLVALLGPWSCLGLSWGGGRVNLGVDFWSQCLSLGNGPRLMSLGFPGRGWRFVACHACAVRGLPRATWGKNMALVLLVMRDGFSV